MKKDRWANHYKQCKGCGTIERPHHAKGLCKRCYDNRWEQKPKAKHTRRKYFAVYNHLISTKLRKKRWELSDKAKETRKRYWESKRRSTIDEKQPKNTGKPDDNVNVDGIN